MTETLNIHTVLGISDERAQEIAKKVHGTMSAHKLVSEGIEAVGTTYELECYGETIYRGMCLATAIDMNRPKKRMIVSAGASLN